MMFVGAAGEPLDDDTRRAAAQDGAADGCDFAVLGPLAVRTSTGSVAIGGPKEQAVLAVLLAQANQVISASRLIEEIWGDVPPRTAAKTLQGYVLRLRQSLEPDRTAGAAPVRLVTAGDGYQLVASPAEIDAGRFEQLVNQAARQRSAGNWPGSVASLRTALSLWRGEPYGAYLDSPVCLFEAERLTELRQAATEDLFDADLHAGRAATIVPELEQLVREHPFRERLWGLLVLALYRSGRQADALRAYQRARSTLVEQVGIEPGPELRQLEARILAHDPALDESQGRAPAASPGFGLPAELASVGPSFVGRRGELDQLRGAWRLAVSGGGGLATVYGPEGVGKTRLVAEVAGLASSEGSAVCYARCLESGSSLLGVVRQLMGNRGTSPADVAGSDGSLTGVGPATRLAGLFAAWAVTHPTLVIIDDVHASEAVARLAAELGAASRQLPVLVVATARTPSSAPSAVVRELAAVGGVTIGLGGLELDEIVSLGSLYHPDEWSVADAQHVLEISEGLPLRVHELISDLARARGGARLVEAAERAGDARKDLAVVEAGIAEQVVSLQAVEERRRAHLRVLEPGADEAGEGVVCPYKGLARFEPEDAPYFFGRERLVALLTARLVGASLMVVTGPSGSGKSSVVRAGLLPALARGVLPGSDSWQLVTMSPGSHPLDELERRLEAAHRVVPRRVVFVDQFEELFSVDAPSERASFVSRLVALLSGDPPTTVLLAVRSDELGRCAAYPELTERMIGNDVLIGPMNDRELARAVEGPAQRAGLRMEAGLSAVVTAEVADRPSALPLLSTALLETWERRQGANLTLAGYRDAGGVQGAVARLAESAYARLTVPQQLAARRILLHLADIDPGRPPDIRRRVPVSEVLAGDDGSAAVALDVLVDRRLLSIDEGTDEGTVEVTHEALLREWPRLREWLEADVEGRRLHRHLATQAAEWEDSGRHPSELLRGPRLSAAVEWADAHADDLTGREASFVAASRAAAEQDAVDARRRADEQLRINRRLRRRLALLAAVAVVAVAAGGAALTQRARAERDARKADALRLATAATALPGDQLDRALLVARQAWQLNDSTETRSAILTLLLRSPRLSRFLSPLGGGVDAAAVSGDGGTIAVAGSDNQLRLFDPRTGRLASAFPVSQTGRTVRVLISPDGRTVATLDGNANLRFWDRRGRALGPPLGAAPPGGPFQAAPAVPSGGFVSEAAFSPDGRALATVDLNGRGLVWDVASERQVGSLPLVNAPSERVDVTFSPDGTRLAIAAAPSIVVDMRSMQTTFVAPNPNQSSGDTSVAFSADGKVLATARGSDIQFWDLATGRAARAPLHADATFSQIRFSADGQLLAAGTAGGSTLLWNARTFEPSGGPLAGQQGPIESVAFVAGTDLVVTASPTSVAVWDAAITGPLGSLHAGSAVPGGAATSAAPGGAGISTVAGGGAGTSTAPGGAGTSAVAFGPHGDMAVTAAPDGTVRLWRTSPGNGVIAPAVLQGSQGRRATALAFDADAGQLALGADDGSVTIFDPAAASTARVTVQVGGGGVTALAFARPSGLLAVGTADGRVLVLASRSWSVRRVISSHQFGSVTSVAFSGDGSMLVSGGDDGHVVLDDIRHQRSTDLAIRGSEKVTAVAYRPDGRLVAAGYSDGVVVLAQPPDGTRSTPLPAGSGPVNAVAFSPDSRQLAVGTADGGLTLWDAHSDQRLGPPLAGTAAPGTAATVTAAPGTAATVTAAPGTAATVTALAFSPTARQLLTVTVDGTTALWTVDPAAWAAAACTLAGRTLTRQEWSQLLPGHAYHPSCKGAAT